MVFAQTMVDSQKKGFHNGNQGMYPAQSAAAFIKDLKVMNVCSPERSPKRLESIAMDLVSKTNDLLGNGTH